MAKVPLLRKILIAAGEDIPPDLGDDVMVVSPSDLSPGVVDELDALSGGAVAGDEEAEPESEPEPEPPVEVSEEEAAAAEVADIKSMAASQVDEMRAMSADCTAIAETIPDAQDNADLIAEKLEEAEKLSADLEGVEDDPDKARELADELAELHAEAVTACEEAKALMPVLGGAEDESGETDDDAEGAEGGDLALWAGT